MRFEDGELALSPIQCLDKAVDENPSSLRFTSRKRKSGSGKHLWNCAVH